MLQNLNFFAPYENLPGHHENQLTRALLVVLRYSPLAHATWLRMITPTLHLESLPPAEFRTQDSRLVRQQKKRDQEDDEAIRGISVLLAPDPTQTAAPVAATDRRQILDGIIEYGSSLVIAIENKIRSGIKTNQPSSINIGNAVVKLDEKVRTVAWQELLEAFADLSSRSLVTGGEQKILDDFLDFAEHHFPQVGPYSTLRRAEKSAARMKRRLDTVLAEAISRPGRIRSDLYEE